MTDIVIVNWNSKDYLRNCIESIFLDSNIVNIETIFIIDNNSSDNSLSLIEANAKIVIIKNEYNRGFAKACNQGFKLCTSEYVLLLNPDSQLLSNTLSECEQFLSRHAEINILGCQLIDENGAVGPSCSRFPAPTGFLNDALGLSKLAPTIFTSGTLMIDFDYSVSSFVDQVMGAFMFMRTTIFQKVGYFDEQFFVYFEEVDFSKRLSDIGGKSYYNSNIKAIHIGKGTTQSIKAFRLYLSLQSRIKYARKHFSKIGYSITWFSTFLIEPFTRILFSIFNGKFKDVGNVLKAYKLLLVNRSNNRQSFLSF